MVQQQHTTINTQTRHAGLAAEHSKVCWFLSDFFLRVPDQTFLSELQKQLAGQQQKISQEPTSALAGLWQILENGVDDKLVKRLAIEYTRLFAGLHCDSGPPPPYESLYRGDTLMGETNLAVTESYLQAGYGDIEKDAGPQDHITAELRFIAMLCYSEIKAFDQGDIQAAALIQQQQQDFLDQHILQWVPEYCMRIQKETNERFYTCVAVMTKEALENMR